MAARRNGGAQQQQQPQQQQRRADVRINDLRAQLMMVIENSETTLGERMCALNEVYAYLLFHGLDPVAAETETLLIPSYLGRYMKFLHENRGKMVSRP